MRHNLPSLQEIEAELAHRKHEEFIHQTWYYNEPFKVGIHTKATCEEIDKAILDFGHGISTCLIITMPPRHGKSDMVSRFLPARFLGLFPWAEVMITTYADSLAFDMSRDAQGIIRSEEYQQIFPDISIAKGSSSVEEWRIEGHTGKVHVGGLLSGITGKGYHLGILDDYCKGREQAESSTIREKTWDAFKDDFITRRAPVSITIVMATTWHIDDVIGRIQKKMKENQNFPRFRIIRFPAKDAKYPTGYLFPERYSKKYYDEAFAVLGSYAAAAELQCDPQVKGGNILKTDKIKISDKLPGDMKKIRAWDLASSEKERTGDDPDYTVGILMSVLNRPTMVEGMYLTLIFVYDIIRGRWEAPARDKKIKETALADGPEVRIAIESVAGYKDAYTTLKDVLKGIRSISKVTTTSDLIVRTSPLEAVFEAGNIFLLKAPWNDDFIQEVANFSGSASLHDDQVAAMVTGYEASKKKEITAIF